ncbi:sulfatase [Flavobacterium ovatum]|uniref:sulfatase family protein n=1 Tax=Flavobacterium ovatum TaxID=1928857 RepID=UPI0034501C5B
MKTKFVTFLIFISAISFAQNRPNILWINSDDLGVELGCYGNKDVKTPHIDQLAKQGALYKNAYATAPVCSTSRSSMITGMYPPAINCQDHRTINMTMLPDGIEPITTYFKNAGYFCSNGSSADLNKKGKEDFNFLNKNLFDGTDWRQRAKGQAFFAQIQIKQPHRPFVRDLKNPIDPKSVTLPACYPDYPLLKADWALYLESIQDADRQVGEIMERLEKDGLLENTIIFFFGDNGRPHLRDKQFLYEGGLKVPLIVRYPKLLKAGKIDQQVVSLIDVTATSLALSNIEVPKHIQGNIFLGKNSSKRKYVYGFRDRTGDAIENMRSITDGRYKLIWNRTPDRSWMQLTSYKKLEYPAFALYHYLYEKGELKAPFNQFMADTKPEVELFDLKKDPMEFNNLENSAKHQKIKSVLLSKLQKDMVFFEKNRIQENAATEKEAMESSVKYYKKGLMEENLGLKVDATYEQIVKKWEKELLVN